MTNTTKTIISIIFLLIIILLTGVFLKYDILYLSAIIGLILSLVAIILSINASSLITDVHKLVEKVMREQIIIKNLILEGKVRDTIDDVKQETKEVEDESDLTEEEKFEISEIDPKKLKLNYQKLIDVLSDEINKWGQYPSSSAVETGPSTAEVIDFVLETKDGSIPIEVKTYPKRIISNNLPYKLRDRMKHIMKLVNVNSSFLIIFNPEITKKSKEIIQEIDEKTKIILIQDNNIEGIRRQFVKYLKKLKPI